MEGVVLVGAAPELCGDSGGFNPAGAAVPSCDCDFPAPGDVAGTVAGG